MSKIKDIKSRRFGSLVVLHRVGSDKLGHSLWECRCDCGSYVVNLSNRLLTGNTKTCGCRNGHGMRYTRLYRTWINMKVRCYDPKAESYKHYGGKGIEVCKEWKNNFSVFCQWAMSSGYKEDLTIDRIENNRNYEPNNCRWASLKQQGRHRSGIKLSEEKAIKIKNLHTGGMSRRNLAKKYGVSRQTVGFIINNRIWR